MKYDIFIFNGFWLSSVSSVSPVAACNSFSLLFTVRGLVPGGDDHSLVLHRLLLRHLPLHLVQVPHQAEDPHQEEEVAGHLDHALGPHQPGHHGAAEEDHGEGLGEAQCHGELDQEEGGGVTQPAGGPEGGVPRAVEGVAEERQGRGQQRDQRHRDQAQLDQLVHVGLEPGGDREHHGPVQRVAWQNGIGEWGFMKMFVSNLVLGRMRDPIPWPLYSCRRGCCSLRPPCPPGGSSWCSSGRARPP